VNHFTLADITPKSIPAVRNLISDVMLDIPYYLSHHKETMVKSVVTEANRVYRLWCKNNPGFERHGRVHLIAHSLGSVIAMDILSKQPTHLPAPLNLDKPMDEAIFEFNTTNLFCVGSPSGFFLLLNRHPLLPRRGRNKPGSEGEGYGEDMAGQAGTYGCLAIDNIYNIMHYSDRMYSAIRIVSLLLTKIAIAYRLNPTVDTELAASLKVATCPSTTPSMFSSLTSPFSKSRQSSVPPVPLPSKPVLPNRLPSTVELEIHDFTREELAERRMLLLNDNGQIDYLLSGGGGALESQYFSMLGAHSSYWESKDFVRFLVLEVGRKPGKGSGIGNFRAEKRRRRGGS
jgi:DDHD domain